MKFQRKIVTPEEAQKRILQHIRLIETEMVTLEQAFGRRLAETVHASHSVPHFRRSTMDGFALVAEETAGASEQSPRTFEVIETVACGSVAKKTLLPGQAIRIMTGAAVPDEADAVVMFEHTSSRESDGISYAEVKKEVSQGINMIPVGMETREGDLLLSAGRQIGPGESALLAMFGHPTVQVYKRPKVAVFATGSELLHVDEPLQPGKIRNSNGYMIAAQLRQAGAEPFVMETVPDDVSLAQKSILAALEEYDAVITTGGVSVGDFDVLYDLTQQWDGELLFNKLSMRPGSTTTVGLYQDKFLFALSGNPGACFVGFEMFARPALLGMQGASCPLPSTQSAILASDYTKADPFTKLLRGIRYVENGRIYAKPVGIDASSVTVSIRDSDCLIVIPYGEQRLRAGDLVEVILVGQLK